MFLFLFLFCFYITILLFFCIGTINFTNKRTIRSKISGISVIVAIRNGGDSTNNIIKYLKNQSYEDSVEFILVDDESTDNTRKFIEDAANLTIIASDKLNKFNDNKHIPFRIFNIGNNSPLKLGRLVKIIEMILKIKSRKKFMSLQKGDMINTFSNSSKIFENSFSLLKLNRRLNPTID